MINFSPRVVNIAEAIAYAEGFYVKDSRPARNHNPGDMIMDLIGKAMTDKDGKPVKDGPYPVFSRDEDGWENLYHQVELWLTGASRHATAESTIFDISRFYTTTEQDAWANNVASYLYVDVDTKIGDISDKLIR